MIRKSTMGFVWFYISIGILIIFLSLWTEKRLNGDIIPSLFLLVILYGLGLFLGLVISILFRKPEQEKTFYFIGQCLSLAFLLAILLISFFDDAQINYAERNDNKMSNTEPQAEIAYDKMKTNFSSPNDFLIRTYFSIGRDSVENFEVNHAWTVYFVYNLKKHPKTTYFSKFIVFKNKASIAEFQIQTKNNQEFNTLLRVNNGIDDIINEYEPVHDDYRNSIKLK